MAATGKEPAPDSIWLEFTTKRFWFLTMLGLVALLISTVWELAIERHHRLSPSPVQIVADPVWYEDHRVYASLIREIGFASWIALVLGVLVERVSRWKQEQTTAAAIDRIAKNVIEATYGLHLPEAIVRHVFSTVIASGIVRSKVSLYFAIEICNLDNYRLLDVTLSYDLKNVSGVPIDHPIRLSIPMQNDPAAQRMARVKGGSIGGVALDEAMIKRGDDAVPNTDYERCYVWPKRIEPGAPLSVELNYCLVKERSDNEIWTSLVPSEALDCVVDMRCDDVEWNIDALHSEKLKPIGSTIDGPYGREKVKFSTSLPLLPHQGIVLWWRLKRVILPAALPSPEHHPTPEGTNQ